MLLKGFAAKHPNTANLEPENVIDVQMVQKLGPNGRVEPPCCQYEIDIINRFSCKAEVYAKYRWDYAAQAIESIFGITQISGESTIADIGAGTGMLSQHFVDKVKNVFAIEPNPEMRKIAEKTLGYYPSFSNINGLADATTLPDQSVDLVTVGRAIQWFPAHSAKREFLRILKPGGWLAIVRVPCADSVLDKAIRSIRTKENGWNVKGDKTRLKTKPLSFFYGSEDFLSLRFLCSKQETWPEFFGRLSSISSAPSENHRFYSNHQRAAKKIFDQFSTDGRLTINVSTELFLGQIKQPRMKARKNGQNGV